MSRVSGLLLASLLLVSCRSVLPTSTSLPVAGPQVQRAIAELSALAAERHSLRAEARVTLEGARGSSFARQLLLLERPARLRLEVMGLLGQRIAVLASDGAHYDLYRAETGKLETAPLRPGLLGEVAGVPLPVEDLVLLLLGVPPRGLESPERATVGPEGRLAIDFAVADGGIQSLQIDPQGDLRGLRLLSSAGHEQVAVRYEDLAATEGFAQQVEFFFGSAGLAAEVTFQRWELGPELEPGLFRLQLVSSPGG